MQLLKGASCLAKHWKRNTNNWMVTKVSLHACNGSRCDSHLFSYSSTPIYTMADV